MTHELACQRQMLVGFVVFCFLFFKILSDRDLQEIWMKRKANDKHDLNQSIFGVKIHKIFIDSLFPKLCSKT